MRIIVVFRRIGWPDKARQPVAQEVNWGILGVLVEDPGRSGRFVENRQQNWMVFDNLEAIPWRAGNSRVVVCTGVPPVQGQRPNEVCVWSATTVSPHLWERIPIRDYGSAGCCRMRQLMTQSCVWVVLPCDRMVTK